MASSEAAPERLTTADLPACLALSDAAGWNQVEADWRVFLNRGAVWGIRLDGEVAASAALLPYPPQTAWISMVLTAEAARGRGFGSRLTAVAAAEAKRRRLFPQLDATGDGERIYGALGFGTLARLTRWRREGANPGGLTPTPDFTLADDLDRAGIGFSRPAMLRHLAGRGPAVGGAGFAALSRDGRMAHHIGPILSASPDRAEAAITAMLSGAMEGRALIVDANDATPGFAAVLERLGFRPARAFRRMALGAAPPPDPARYCAAAGPEFG